VSEGWFHHSGSEVNCQYTVPPRTRLVAVVIA